MKNLLYKFFLWYFDERIKIIGTETVLSDFQAAQMRYGPAAERRIMLEMHRAIVDKMMADGLVVVTSKDEIERNGKRFTARITIIKP